MQLLRSSGDNDIDVSSAMAITGSCPFLVPPQSYLDIVATFRSKQQPIGYTSTHPPATEKNEQPDENQGLQNPEQDSAQAKEFEKIPMVSPVVPPYSDNSENGTSTPDAPFGSCPIVEDPSEDVHALAPSKTSRKSKAHAPTKGLGAKLSPKSIQSTKSKASDTLKGGKHKSPSHTEANSTKRTDIIDLVQQADNTKTSTITKSPSNTGEQTSSQATWQSQLDGSLINQLIQALSFVSCGAAGFLLAMIVMSIRNKKNRASPALSQQRVSALVAHSASEKETTSSSTISVPSEFKIENVPDKHTNDSVELRPHVTQEEVVAREFEIEQDLRDVRSDRKSSPLLVPEDDRVKPDEELVKEIELRAMEKVTQYETSNGRRVVDVSMLFVGYDLKSIDPTTKAKRAIEVKGKASKGTIILTVNEWRIAKELGKSYYLYIVENALSEKPNLRIIQDPASVLTASKARHQYRLSRASYLSSSTPISQEKRDA